MYIETMLGLGDCIYLRPILKWLPVRPKLITPWPQIFPEYQCCRPIWNHLRTQRDNIANYQGDLLEATPYPEYKLTYDLDRGTIQENYCNQLLGFQPKYLETSLIVQGDPFVKPLCLIRPNTIRKEWPCYARNPKTEYLQRFIDKHRKQYYFITLVNVKPDEEWIDGELDVDEKLINQPIEKVLTLFQSAALIVTSPSFWVALGLEMHKRMLVIYGAHEEHFRINDKRIDHSQVTIIEPKPFDRCPVAKRNAFKDIDEVTLEEIYAKY